MCVLDCAPQEREIQKEGSKSENVSPGPPQWGLAFRKSSHYKTHPLSHLLGEAGFLQVGRLVGSLNISFLTTLQGDTPPTPF